MNHPAAPRALVVKTMHVGPMASCCYLAGLENGDGVIIDPGDEAERIIQNARQAGFTIRHIILTHAHADHIGALEEVRSAFPDAEAVAHADDAPMLGRPSLNLSLFLGSPIKCRPPDRCVAEGDTIALGHIRLAVIHVPGHTPGGACYYSAEAGVVFTGDVLFAGGIGRSDFPGGNESLLLRGIRCKLLGLPPETIVYPGHGPATTIGEEKEHNPFI